MDRIEFYSALERLEDEIEAVGAGRLEPLQNLVGVGGQLGLGVELARAHGLRE